ncbi:hypothetical protein BGP_6402 [Beggiatoa sp. PS]|nr:hypothetical protein BGP_6402 [Beggiatoa sp. PS]
MPKEAILLCFVLREKQRIEREIKGWVKNDYLPKGIRPDNIPSCRKTWELIKEVENIYFEGKN